MQFTDLLVFIDNVFALLGNLFLELPIPTDELLYPGSVVQDMAVLEFDFFYFLLKFLILLLI